MLRANSSGFFFIAMIADGDNRTGRATTDALVRFSDASAIIARESSIHD